MRVHRAFAFIDLSGFTSLTATHGDETAVNHLAGFRLAVREVCSRRGVRIAKWLGDGAMLVSVETEAAVAAVLELEHRVSGSPLALRGGMTEGDVILFEGDDYIGHAVNMAARLCDMALPHEVLAVGAIVTHVPTWAEADPLGLREVRGLGEPVEVFELARCPHDRASLVDPVCAMELPAESVVATRTAADGSTVGFCSLSCAETWEGRRSPAESPGLVV